MVSLVILVMCDKIHSNTHHTCQGTMYIRVKGIYFLKLGRACVCVGGWGKYA